MFDMGFAFIALILNLKKLALCLVINQSKDSLNINRQLFHSGFRECTSYYKNSD